MKKEFNKSWIFCKDSERTYTNTEISQGEEVVIPHSYNAEDGQNGGPMWKGNASYQKTVHLSKEMLDEYHYLEIGAASLVSQVYVNGELAGSSRCGFSMYRVFLSPFLQEGTNLITIMVDNSAMTDVYPLMADFSFYGGIYRDVYWVTTQAIHFDLLDKSRDGIYVEQTKLDDKKYGIKVSGSIVQESANADACTIRMRLLDACQTSIVETSQSIELSQRTEFSIEETLEDVHLWQGIEDPYLYTVELEIVNDQGILDQRTIEFGFRTVEFTPDKGVFLNGKPIKIDGVSRHQDYAGLGNALTREQMEEDIKLIQEVGANSIRLAHYQHDDYFYTLCDRAGFLVWAEIPFISVPTTTDAENKNAKEQLECLIKQAYNHTSIYCWGVQNEITIAIENEKIYEMVQELADMARAMDPKRLIAQANIHSVTNDSQLNSLTDIVGYNLYYGWYYKEMKELAVRLDAFHDEQPNVPVLVTEYGVDTNPAYHSYTPGVKDYTEEYQVLFHENALRTFNSRPYVMGGYVWAMFDFGSASRNEGGKKGRNQKGLITMDRQLKKDAFYLCKAFWSKEPFVKLAGSRFVNRHEKNNDIAILTNLKQCSLYVNEQKVGSVEDADKRYVFEGIELELGDNTIRVEATDTDGQCYIDSMTLCYREEKDSSYELVVEKKSDNVTNWFEKFDLSEVQDYAIKDGYYSTFDTLQELLQHDETREIFEKYFGDIAQNPQIKAMSGLMTIESMSKRSRFRMPKELLTVINKELNTIKKA